MVGQSGIQVGADIGRRSTEVVVCCAGDIIGTCVYATTDDVGSGLGEALTGALENAANLKGQEVSELCQRVECCKVGLSSLTKAIQERRGLSRVAVIRLCGPTTQGLPPFSDVTPQLKEVLGGPAYMIDGGFMLDGEAVVRPLNKAEIDRCADDIQEKGILNMVVSGVFSLKNNAQELQVRQWILDRQPHMSITLTHQVGYMSLLLRENAAIINESLRPLTSETVRALNKGLEKLNISCAWEYVLNDGTLVKSEILERFPIRTYGAGTTSSMRAASLLTAIQDGVVLDVGIDRITGGNIKDGQPGIVHNKVKVGDILASIARPDVLSVLLGKLTQQLQQPSETGIPNAVIADIVDKIKSSKKDVALVFVGESAARVSTSELVKGTTSVILSAHHQVIHAIGALLAAGKDEPCSISCLSNCKRDIVQSQDASSSPTTTVSNGNAVSPNGPSPDLGTEYNHINMMDSKSLSDQVHIDAQTGEWILSEHDIECIAIGAGILGCGGGGNPYFGKLSALQQIRSGKKIRVISAKRFHRQSSSQDYAFPVASMGAPVAQAERLTDPFRLRAAVEALADLYAVEDYNDDSPVDGTDFGSGNVVLNEGGNSFIEDFKAPPGTKFANGKKNIAGVLAVEIGGSNAMEPFLLASEIDVPVIDCDCMGRALPEIQMFSQYIYGSNWYPAAVGDSNGRKWICLHAESPKHIEDFCRKSCIEMGSLASFCARPLSSQELLSKTILYSTSRAWRLGQMVCAAKLTNTSPINAILQFEHGKLICTAKITDVTRDTSGGFTRGEIILQGRGEFASRTFSILFHNENLIAQEITEEGKTQILATVPDLISIVDVEEGESIPTDEIKYGQWVAVLALPAPTLLSTPQALKVVGPQAFGYKGIEYRPVGTYSTHESVPPE